MIPPDQYLGGWACFVVSLFAIVLVTVLLIEVSDFFGCATELNKRVIAFTIVSLGTSVPDTFASVAAAKQDKYADASVGNINGSNSVNVFLGIGLPWSIAAIYWSFQSHESRPDWKTSCCRRRPSVLEEIRINSGPNKLEFVVISTGLAATVVMFLSSALVAFSILAIRRHSVNIGGELGGPRRERRFSCAVLFLLWVVNLTYAVAS
jgi:solute carrier family 8 (sodium/calcium exchanger)